MLSFLFRCFKSHCTNWLIKALGVDNSLGNPAYTSTTLTKEKRTSWKIIGLYCVSFRISINDDELDLRHSSVYSNYIHVLTTSVMLLSLSDAPRNTFPNYLHQPAFTTELQSCYDRGCVNQIWILEYSKDVCSTHKQCLHCHLYHKTFALSTLYITIISRFKLKNRLKEWPISVQISCFRKGQILFCNKPFWFYTKKKVSWNWHHSNLARFWLTTYLLLLVDVLYTDSSHSYRYLLWFSSWSLVLLFVWIRFNAGACLEKQKEAKSVLQYHVF